MANPAPSNRQVPAGEMLRNGYQALVCFAINPAIEFWEKVVTSLGYDLGEKIDITTQHNKQVKTAAAPVLVEIKDMKITAAYDPIIFNEFHRARFLGVETTVTKLYPNGDTLAFYGYASSFEAEGEEHGKQPEITINVKVTNCDPTLPRSFHRRATPRQLPPINPQGQILGPDGKPTGKLWRPEFPEHLILGAGTGTAYIANEFPPVWTTG